MSDFVSITDREMRTNKSSPRPAGQRITRIIMHHWAGTGTGGIQRLVHSSDQASANYIIADGQIIGSVPESRRAWTSGSAAADNPSITVEVQNSAGAPGWPVSAANLRALVRLLAAIADKYGWGALGNSHLRGHREFASTACPGPYLWPRRAQIIRDAQGARGGGSAPSKPAPKPSGKAWPDVALPARDSHNTATHRAWVKLMADVGYTDNSLTVAIQKWLRSFGKYNVGPADGHFGPRTIRALQRFLVERGHLPNSAYVDGDRGPVTIRAEIAYLNSQRQYYS